MGENRSRWQDFLKMIGAVPRSVEFKIGDEVLAMPGNRTAVVVGVVPLVNGEFKVKVLYNDNNEVAYLAPDMIAHPQVH